MATSSDLAAAAAFLPGKSHGQRSLAGYSSWGRRNLRHNSATKQPPHASLKREWPGNSLAVQWLGLQAFTTGGMGPILGQRTKILHATWHPSPPPKNKREVTCTRVIDENKVDTFEKNFYRLNKAVVNCWKKEALNPKYSSRKKFHTLHPK